jgi:hypothetical protein
MDATLSMLVIEVLVFLGDVSVESPEEESEKKPGSGTSTST